MLFIVFMFIESNILHCKVSFNYESRKCSQTGDRFKQWVSRFFILFFVTLLVNLHGPVIFSERKKVCEW